MKKKLKPDQALFGVAVLYALCVYGSMAMMSIGAGAVFGFWLIFRYGKLKSDLKKFSVSPLLMPTIVLTIACIWSLVWVKLTDLTFLGAKPNIEWVRDIRKLWHVFFPFILAAVFSSLNAKQLKTVYKSWLLLGLFMACFGIIQHYVPIYKPLALPDPGLQGLYHSTGMTGFHLSFASIIGFSTAAWLGLFAILFRRQKFSKKTMRVGGIIIILIVCTIFTYSKMAWGALLGTIMTMLFLGFKGRHRYILTGAVLVAAGLMALLPEVRLRFQGTDTIVDRVEVWSANVEMIKQQPLFGVGWHHNSELSYAFYEGKNFKKSFASHAHNNLIDQWATTGLFGLFAFLWWNFVVFKMSFRIYLKNQDLIWRSLGLGLIGGWVCLHLNGLTQTNYWDAKVMHQMGFVTAMMLEGFRRYAVKKA